MNNRLIPITDVSLWVPGAAPAAFRPQSSQSPNVYATAARELVIVQSNGAWSLMAPQDAETTTKSNVTLQIVLANPIPGSALTTILINDIKAAVDLALAAPSAWKTAYDAAIAANASTVEFDLTVIATMSVTGPATEANLRGSIPNFNGSSALQPFGQVNSATTNWPLSLGTARVSLATPADALLTLTASGSTFLIADMAADVTGVASLFFSNLTFTALP